MHELSLAQSLLDQLISLADQHKASSISTVTVTLGPFSGIVADSFDFGFNILKKEKPETENARLVIETPAPEYLCLECNTESTTETPEPELAGPVRFTLNKHTCPQCGSDRLSPQGGTDLILKQIEME